MTTAAVSATGGISQGSTSLPVATSAATTTTTNAPVRITPLVSVGTTMPTVPVRDLRKSETKVDAVTVVKTAIRPAHTLPPSSLDTINQDKTIVAAIETKTTPTPGKGTNGALSVPPFTDKEVVAGASSSLQRLTPLVAVNPATGSLPPPPPPPLPLPLTIAPTATVPKTPVGAATAAEKQNSPSAIVAPSPGGVGTPATNIKPTNSTIDAIVGDAETKKPFVLPLPSAWLQLQEMVNKFEFTRLSGLSPGDLAITKLERYMSELLNGDSFAIESIYDTLQNFTKFTKTPTGASVSTAISREIPSLAITIEPSPLLIQGLWSILSSTRLDCKFFFFF